MIANTPSWGESRRDRRAAVFIVLGVSNALHPQHHRLRACVHNPCKISKTHGLFFVPSNRLQASRMKKLIGPSS